MMTQNFMIGPIGDGLRKDVKPYATPEDSFTMLLNAYQFRGRVVRRSGYTLLGRLANNTPVMGLRTRELFDINAQDLIAFDTTKDYVYDTGSMSFIPLPSLMPVTWSGTDWQFFYTINYAGALWATNSKPGLHGFAVNLFANQSGTGLTAQVNVTAPGNTLAVGDIVYFLNISGAAIKNNLAYGQVTAINVGGNPNVVTVISLNPLATFAFVNGATPSGLILSSTTSIPGQDGIRYYGDLNYGTPGTQASWANYNPPIDPNNALAGCLLMFAYRGYLVFLNTSEGNDQTGIVNYGNRARWTQIGTPYYSLPVPGVPALQTWDPKAARDDLFGRGGANDAPTNEVIVAAAFIRDILVVYFERSTWRLRFVNNSQNPFVWERVNVELGSDCTFSSIPFDKGLMAIGNRGIVISDSNDTQRFDEKIPDDIFTIRQGNHGFQRVYGIRTFRTKLNFWTFPNPQNPEGIYPDSVLVFNYETKNWSFFDDSFTCFGYFYLFNTGFSWGDLTDPWPSYADMSVSNGVTQEGQETVVAGNQQGFVFKLEQTTPQNSPSLFIQNIVGNVVTSPNHNLSDGDWITLSGVTGITFADGTSLNGRNFKVANPMNDPNIFMLSEFEVISGPQANGSSYSTVTYTYVLKGSVQINIGALVFTDPNLDGILVEAAGLGTGTINYKTGSIFLSFTPALGAPTDVFIRVVSLDPGQEINVIDTAGVYTGGGLIAKISNFEITSKVFNFFGQDQSARLSKIDFYVQATAKGQFTCNIFADSSDVVVNKPLRDNLQSNVVLTSTNQYQVGKGPETLYRLYCHAVSQTVQVQLTLSDQQMAVNSINDEDVEINAMIFSLRKGGRLI